MKVFFMAPMRGQEVFNEIYSKIYQYLEDNGCTIVDKVVLEKKSSEFYKELEDGGEKAYHEYYQRMLNNLKIADINIFDASFPSLGTGFQILKSLELNKPTVVLYQEENPPHAIIGTMDDRFILKKYTKTNLKKVIKEVLELSKERADKRFNFFINPRLLAYLEETSKEQGITKSMFIRNLLLEHMRGAKKPNV